MKSTGLKQGVIYSHTEVMNWWNKMSLEVQFYKLIESKVIDNATRHPDTLSALEILEVYSFHH